MPSKVSAACQSSATAMPGAWLVVGVLLVGCAAGLAQTAPAARLSGTWEGQVLLEGNWRFMEANFGQDGHGGVKVDLPQQRREFRDFAVHGNDVKWTLARGEDRIQFEGVSSGDLIRGRAEQGGSSGEFQLVRMRRSAPAEERHLAATYQTADGALITVARFDFGDGVDRLAILDVRGGHWGVLIPTGADRYLFSPARSGRFPTNLRVEFRRASDGTGRTVLITPEGGNRSTANRLDAYDSRNVSFTNGDVTLAGTVLRPRTPGRHPGVVMAHSSGHQSRNGPVAYFRLLANVMAANGIATLAYDKRGVGDSTGSWFTASFDDLAGDVRAAVAAMRREPGVDPDRVGVWSLSQGGWVAPLAAAADRRIAFLALVSAAATTPAQQEIDRVALVMTAQGRPDRDVDAASRYLRLFFDTVAGRQPWASLQKAMTATASASWTRYVPRPESARDLGWSPAPATLDPAPVLRTLAVPILSIHGTDDLDVPASVNSRLFAKVSTHTQSRQQVFGGADHYMLQTITDPDRQHRRLTAGYIPLLLEWIGQASGAQ